jgi:hypothetical protein
MRNTIFAISFVSLLLSTGAVGAPVEDANSAGTPGTPTGGGDPDAVACRAPIRLSRKQDWVQRFGPEVYRTNRFWADIIKNHQMVDARGVVSPRQLPYNYYGDRDFSWVPSERWGYDSGQQQSGMPMPTCGNC